jgi:hypothetical protein
VFENRSYLGEFVAEFKKAVAHESEAQGGIVRWKKTEGRKSRDTVSLKSSTGTWGGIFSST